MVGESGTSINRPPGFGAVLFDNLYTLDEVVKEWTINKVTLFISLEGTVYGG